MGISHVDPALLLQRCPRLFHPTGEIPQLADLLGARISHLTAIDMGISHVDPALLLQRCPRLFHPTGEIPQSAGLPGARISHLTAIDMGISHVDPALLLQLCPRHRATQACDPSAYLVPSQREGGRGHPSVRLRWQAGAVNALLPTTFGTIMKFRSWGGRLPSFLAAISTDNRCQLEPGSCFVSDFVFRISDLPFTSFVSTRGTSSGRAGSRATSTFVVKARRQPRRRRMAKVSSL